jgi:hypothetical protein
MKLIEIKKFEIGQETEVTSSLVKLNRKRSNEIGFVRFRFPLNRMKKGLLRDYAKRVELVDIVGWPDHDNLFSKNKMCVQADGGVDAVLLVKRDADNWRCNNNDARMMEACGLFDDLSRHRVPTILVVRMVIANEPVIEEQSKKLKVSK